MLHGSQEIVKEPFKVRFIKYAKTRMGFTVVSWAIGLSMMLISIISLSHINKSYELGVMVFATFICNIGSAFLKFQYSGYLQLDYSFCKVYRL